MNEIKQEKLKSKGFFKPMEKIGKGHTGLQAIKENFGDEFSEGSLNTETFSPRSPKIRNSPGDKNSKSNLVSSFILLIFVIRK